MKDDSEKDMLAEPKAVLATRKLPVLLGSKYWCEYYIKYQQDATLAVLFISHCKITLHVSDAFCVHHQEY